MPDIPDPSRPQAFHRPPSFGYGDQSTSYSHDPYDDHEQGYAIDPEEHHDSYYHEAYQPDPQDIPLLPQNPLTLSHEQLYDPHPQDDPSTLHHRGSNQSIHHDPNSASSSGVDVTNDKTGGEREEAAPKGHFGHLVYDCPVPPKLLRNIEHSGRDEFTHMRYTAATCDPADFTAERFTLRPQLYGKARRTELFIVVTMYNEDDVLFARTMIGVFKNIEYMCSMKGKHGGLWDADGWKKIVVCVVVDGRAKLDARTRALITALGL